MRSTNKKLLIITFFFVWITGASYGFFTLWDYENTPGLPGEPPKNWPKASSVKLSAKTPTLLMFLHPRCPCSEASIEELARLYSHIKEKVKSTLIFYKPQKFNHDWVKSDLWDNAHRIPNATVTIDSENKMINLFNPKTSGQVYLYNKEGTLIYSGGITGGRGHAGDNLGSKIIREYILNNKIIKQEAFVFGCSLFHEGQEHDN
ncbi:MAG: hypothetical protein CL678_12715 [Bdellovibrionaceae bacterium]|nr:hypothetical protein [Pseudobdellovibrionaceae bacterium]|tara:strand:+ start:1341 stop:1952 length:612 start_codon:yes stop_codon:yes gene_type:complete